MSVPRGMAPAVGGSAAGLLLALCALLALPARASAFQLDRAHGHLAFGYGRLVVSDPPAGSLNVAAGLDYPIRPGLREGLDLGFYLFGNRTVNRGSLNATIDYSAFDLIAFTHWDLAHGPLARVSVGPGLTHLRAELSSAAGGALFLDLAASDLVPTAALDLTVMRHEVSPVRVAIVLSARSAFRRGEDWNHFSARFGFHY